MNVFLAGGFAERGTKEYIESYERARLDAGMLRRLMAFGTKNQEKYIEFYTKVFFAGNTGFLQREQACRAAGMQRRLYSYVQKKLLIDRLGIAGGKFMLDSGAFSAHSRGIDIDLQEYADFVVKHSDAFNTVVNLDVIPGKPGTGLNRDPKEAERAAEASWRNWVDLTAALKSTGIVPIPVYHLGENRKWLTRMMDETGYIAIGGSRHGTSQDRIAWLDSLMPALTDDQGYPSRKFHGLAATSLEIMSRYPFYSVDSTSWLQTGLRGAILIPRGVLGPREREIVFSDDPRALHNRTADHFRSLGRVEREPVVRYLASKNMTPRMLAEKFCLTCGTTFKRTPLTCCAAPEPNIDYMRRDEMNIAAWLEIERSLEPRPWKGYRRLP